MSLEKPRPQPGILARLATLIGAGVAAASPATAQGADASAAPAEWIRYANGAADAISGWLQADSETAVRFRSYLDQALPDAGRPAAPLTMKIWVDRDGVVSRIAFSPFVHAEPNADLHALVRELFAADDRVRSFKTLVIIRDVKTRSPIPVAKSAWSRNLGRR